MRITEIKQVREKRSATVERLLERFEDPWEHYEKLSMDEQWDLAMEYEQELIAEVFVNTPVRRLNGGERKLMEIIAESRNPCGTEPCLWDADGILSLADDRNTHLDERFCVNLIRASLEMAFAHGDRIRMGKYEAIRVREYAEDMEEYDENETRYAFYHVKDIPELFGDVSASEPLKEAA